MPSVNHAAGYAPRAKGVAFAGLPGPPPDYSPVQARAKMGRTANEREPAIVRDCTAPW